MKVTILEPSGYCSGVEHAMNLAIRTKKENPLKSVVILGMLVHNKESLKTLEKLGINTIYKENCSLKQLIDLINEPSIVILTAHGHSESVEKALIKNGHQIVDATCPFVKNSFSEISKAVKENKTVFYIGVKNHPESTAALSISDKVVFINAKNPVFPSKIEGEILVISQTTLSKFETQNIENNIKDVYPNAIFLNGICNASTKRQESILNIKEDFDALFIVGSTTSNNSKTLFNLAKETYKNKVVKLIENEEEINKKDLIGLSHIIIASGASTPKEVIAKVKTKLLN